MNFAKKIALCYIIILCSTFVKAQEFIQNEPSMAAQKEHFIDPDRLFFGGGFGLQFGNVDMVSIAPEVGYRITDKLSAGVGVSYFYFASSGSQSFSTNIYGGKVFGSFAVFETGLLHAEYEMLNLESKYFNPNIFPETKRFNISSFLVGPGYRFQMGENSYVNLLVLWNLNETIYSPYSNPIIRMSFEF